MTKKGDGKSDPSQAKTQGKAAASEGAETASPVCYAGEADPAYMGYAARCEILSFLNELLEAERAGALVTAKTAKEASEPALRSLMEDIRRDETRWCAMLLEWIARLEGEASSRVGDFHERCMAIRDIGERIAFLNRGQGWVARKLREMLPKIADERLHRDLAAMRASHEENIARTNDAQNGTQSR